ncbi:LPS assembly lipoprotein LptE [Mucilaginibacter sp.]|uniref:LPS assembly lipoprotein LptE n=1 Tax=Mucilaginibacter sp. TaxID=1882438 RepID=UPI003D0E7BC0
MKRITGPLVILGLILISQACTYSLSLNGASIPATMKTIRVDFFENNAQLVVNTLSQQFTEALKDRIRNTTRLNVVRGEADAIMSGTITDYNIAPVSIQATNNNVAPIAGQSRLTITVNVKYVYDADKKLSFEQSFSKYKDFSGDIASQEQALIADINKQLTEDIFNRAFANWN